MKRYIVLGLLVVSGALGADDLPALKQRISSAILKFRQELLPFMPGRNAEEKAANFLAIFSSMIGTIAIARTMPDAAIRQSILNRVREERQRLEKRESSKRHLPKDGSIA